MNVFTNLEKAKFINATFILGGFEAIHKGHLELINKAKDFGIKNIVFCLLENPSQLPGSRDGNMLQLEVRLETLKNLGIKNVLVFDFSKIKDLEPNDFIDTLIDKGATKLVVGKDYRLGKFAKWSSKDLKNYFPETYIVDLLKENNIKIATSLLKESIIFGDLDFVNTFLFMPYAIDFNRTEANNLAQWPENVTQIGKGIYIVNLLFSDLEFHGLLKVGFDGIVEWKILDDDFTDMDTNRFRVEFLEKIRPIISQEKDIFSKKDVEIAINFFSKK